MNDNLFADKYWNTVSSFDLNTLDLDDLCELWKVTFWILQHEKSEVNPKKDCKVTQKLDYEQNIAVNTDLFSGSASKSN